MMPGRKKEVELEARDFWALAPVYEPNGPQAVRLVRYRVTALPLTDSRGFNGFIFQGPRGYQVHEEWSGQWLATGSTVTKAIALANRYVDLTANFKSTINMPVMKWPVMDKDEVFRRLGRGIA